MATSRDIRRLAFQTLFQLDAMGGAEHASIREHMDESIREMDVAFSNAEREKAVALALGAYEQRAKADKVMAELAPTWPAARQAAVDRAILRLAHFEMTAGKTPPKVVVNEAVELAKVFSTEKSPSFINGLLDKVLKSNLRDASTPADGSGGDAGDSGDEAGHNTDPSGPRDEEGS